MCGSSSFFSPVEASEPTRSASEVKADVATMKRVVKAYGRLHKASSARIDEVIEEGQQLIEYDGLTWKELRLEASSIFKTHNDAGRYDRYSQLENAASAVDGAVYDTGDFALMLASLAFASGLSAKALKELEG